MHIFFHIVIHVCVYMYYNNNNVIYSLFSDFLIYIFIDTKLADLNMGNQLKL